MIGLTLAVFAYHLKTPLDLGMEELKALGSQASKVSVTIAKGGPKESYQIHVGNGKVSITGSDATGAMYGAFEFVERVHRLGQAAWTKDVKGSPFLPDRGLNLFTTLPWDYQKNDTDYDNAALTNPDRWWFQNDDYWTTLLDLMAHSRLNWLDIHGMWDVSSTRAPNLYAYFVTSPSFPKVGVPDIVKAANLARLNKVVAMAHERGIRVSLMAYEAGLSIPQNPQPPYQADEPTVYKYTKESVEQMIRGVPGLDAIGFRIGESGKSESFFKCYGEAVKASGRNIPLVTRSWITRRQRVLPLARASNDFTVEIKYNGEQWGAPYPLVGGRMATWNSYSFEDYLSDSGVPSKNTKTWSGWPTSDGSHWPSNPYKVVWQVRANGTHRIFPFYNPAWVRKSISAMRMGTASGYTIEGEDAYYPKSPLYYLAKPEDQYCNWIHQRDELYWMTWGRLGYDPSTPDNVFDAKINDWFGAQEGPKIAQVWKQASQVVPLSFMASSLGPDHRDHAPELETGGDTQAFIDGQPLDPFVLRSVHETVGLKSMGVRDGRIGVDEVGAALGNAAQRIRLEVGQINEGKLPPESRKRYLELKNSFGMLSGLAMYHSGRLGSAMLTASQESETGADLLMRATSTPTPSVRPGSLNPWDISMNASSPSGFSLQHPFNETWKGWMVLSDSSASDFYKPFTERLRMHTNTFHWKSLAPQINGDNLLGLDKVAPTYVPSTPPSLGWANLGDSKLSWKRVEGKLIVKLTGNGIQHADLLYKPLPSPTFFHKVAMSKVGTDFQVAIADETFGACLAAEVESSNQLIRIPFFLSGQKPYVVVPAKPGPTAQIYGSEEALAFLDPKVLTPEKHGVMMICPRAFDFFKEFNKATRRKLLDPVSRGMTLMVLQEDFLSRYQLDFLPRPLRVEASPDPNVFDGGKLLGLPKLESKGIMWQHFVPSEGWDVPGNGGIAHMKYGKGEIYVLAGRFMQRMTDRHVAQALRKLLEKNGRSKPAILVDPGTEGAVFSTSVYADMLNALNIPFLLLGEVIAKEQGPDDLKPIEGPTMDDDVLGGKGRNLADTFLRKRVQMASAVPTPTKSQFEAVRQARKKELNRMLGLDPMPAKTPLNARKTGELQGNGFHIEKVVFESRPNFYVTAHIYKADRVRSEKLPVIVNVNGHWAHKKDEDRIQLRCQFQALQGYIAIAIDSPGHSFEGDSLIERKSEGEHDDYAMVEGGTNTTGYYVWDAIRALDYMETRPDTDMKHIGITGASGGGLATLYTFAADDRYTAAVPVVYMSSLELAPDNGCLCNHVPGTCQIGDRSDVIGIQAPKPVYIMGAQNDGEFTPAGMLHTNKKMVDMWSLFDKGSDALVQVYAGGHDYNKPMRESMIGFFNKYLKGEGDGSPVPEPELKVWNSEDRQLLVLDPPIAGERTMRDLSKEYLANAPAVVSAADAILVNGGLPERSNLHYREIGDGDKRAVVFEPMAGLQIPGILHLPKGRIDKVVIVLSDSGKAEAQKQVPTLEHQATLYLDGLGTGELAGVEMRYAVYLGASVPFLNGWATVRAADAMVKYSSHVEIVGQGAISSQAMMWAGLIDHRFEKVTGQNCLKSWVDVFETGVSDYAVQPRAHLCGSLDHLRSLVKNGHWTF